MPKTKRAKKDTFRVRKGMLLVNDNGDVWRVETVHRGGGVTISFGGGGGDDAISYTDGQIQSWFRPLVGVDADTNRDYVDPKRYR